MAKKKNRNRNNSASGNQNKNNNITEIKESAEVSAAELFGADAVADTVKDAAENVTEAATDVAKETVKTADAVAEAPAEVSVEDLFGNIENATEGEAVTEVEALPVNEAMMISSETNEAMPSIVVTENSSDFMQVTADNSGASMPGIELDTTPRPSELKAAEDMAAISLAAGMDALQPDTAGGTAIAEEVMPTDVVTPDEAPATAEEIAPATADVSTAKTTEIITDDAAYFEAMGIVSGAEPPRDISQITKPRTIEEARLFYANYRPPEKKAEPETEELTELPIEEEADKDKKKMFFYIILGAAALIVLIVCIIMMVTYKRDDGNTSVGGNVSQSSSVTDSGEESENGGESDTSTDKPASSDDKTSDVEKPASSDKENNDKPASSTTTDKKPSTTTTKKPSTTTTKKPSTTTTKNPSTTTTKNPSTSTANGAPSTPAPETPSSTSTTKPAPVPDTTSTTATDAPKPETTTTTKAPETTTTKKPETTTAATTTTTATTTQKPETTTTTTTTTTKKPETTPAPVPETPKFTFEAINLWNGGGSFTLTNNTDKTVTSWTITLTVPAGFELNGGWSGDYTLSGTTLTIRNLNWNGEIKPGDSKDFGFQYSCPTEVNFDSYKVNVTY